MKKNRIGILLVLMLLIGVCALLYPSVSQYWNTKTQTRAVENYQDILQSLQPEDYTSFFEEAEAYNAALSELKSPLVDYRKLEGYDEKENEYVSIPSHSSAHTTTSLSLTRTNPALIWTLFRVPSDI